MTKQKLLCGASVLILGSVAAGNAFANPINKFSDGSLANVTVNSTVTAIASGSNVVDIERGNISTEVLATNNLDASFVDGDLSLGNAAAAASADASAVASAAASAAATASGTSDAQAAASADASATASTNAVNANNTSTVANVDQGENAATAAADAAASDAGSAYADAAADAAAAGSAAADASADAAAARGGDLLNAAVLLNVNAMQRAAGAFAQNMGTAQFTNLNVANAVAANSSGISIGSQ